MNAWAYLSLSRVAGQPPLLGDTHWQEYLNGEASEWQASFLSEWGQINNTTIWAWKKESLLQQHFQVDFHLQRQEKLVKQQTTLLVFLYFVNINALMTFFFTKENKI